MSLVSNLDKHLLAWASDVLLTSYCVNDLWKNEYDLLSREKYTLLGHSHMHFKFWFFCIVFVYIDY